MITITARYESKSKMRRRKASNKEEVRVNMGQIGLGEDIHETLVPGILLPLLLPEAETVSIRTSATRKCIALASLRTAAHSHTTPISILATLQGRISPAVSAVFTTSVTILRNWGIGWRP
jgi:hypothetical protein